MTKAVTPHNQTNRNELLGEKIGDLSHKRKQLSSMFFTVGHYTLSFAKGRLFAQLMHYFNSSPK